MREDTMNAPSPQHIEALNNAFLQTPADGEPDAPDAKKQASLAINKAKGRKDADGVEVIIKMKPAKDEIGRLLKLKVACDEATENYNSAVKFVAEQAGLQASVVNKFVRARAGEHFEDKKRDCEQLQLMFDEIGAGT